MDDVPRQELIKAEESPQRGRVYIVDDEVEVRDSLRVLLKSNGYNALVVEDPADFLARASSHREGVILLDLRMPGVGGNEFLQILDGSKNRFAVIMMSGHGDIELAVRSLHLGAKDFLEKPLKEDVLIAVLDREWMRLSNKAGAQQRSAGARVLLGRLTERERDVLEGLAVGKSNKVIAYELGISVRTAEMHRGRMMARLGCKTLAQALYTYHSAQAETDESHQEAPT